MSKILLKLRDEKGQNLVEFALIVVLLLAIVFGIIEFGRAWYTADRLKNAANIAARTAAVTKSAAAATTAANNAMGGSANVVFSPPSVGTCTSNCFGNATSVKATAKQYFQSVVPIVGDVPIFGNHTISRDATYRVER